MLSQKRDAHQVTEHLVTVLNATRQFNYFQPSVPFDNLL